MPPILITRPSLLPAGPRIALAVMACAIGIAHPAQASDCGGEAAPDSAAGTEALYGELANRVSAEPLAVAIAQRSIGGSCTWVYEVRVLTIGGSVAVLDFDLVDLNLKRVIGPQSDPDIANLRARLGEGNGSEPSADGASGSADDDSGDVSGSDDSGEGGEGSGNSGSGSSGSGSGGSGSSGSGSSGSGSGSSGSGSGSGSGEGGEGGEGGSDGGGEGGEGGGDN